MYADKDHWLWYQLAPFYRDGDRFIHYSRPSQTGTLMVRGDRLVWQVLTLQKHISTMPLRWKASHDKFLELGGTRAFLAGEFVWPPEGWVNPVKEHEEALAAEKSAG